MIVKREWMVAIAVLLMLTASLALPAGGTGTTCKEQSCLFLPLIHRPSPLSFSVKCVERSRTGVGSAVAGSVLNIGSQAVYSATVRADMYDTDDNLIDSQSVRLYFDETLPTHGNIFHMYGNFWWETPRIEFVVESFVYSNASNLVPLTILSQQAEGVNQQKLVVSGSLRNDTAYTLQSVQVGARAACFAGTQSIDATLAPGEVMDYEVLIKNYHLYLGPVPAEVFAQGVKAP